MAWVEKLDNGTWRGRYKDPNGRPQTAADPATGKKSHTSKRHALKLAQDEESKIRNGSWINPMAGTMTFSDYFENHWLENKVAEDNTTSFYESMYNAQRFGLKKVWGETQLRRILFSAIQAWVSQMTKDGMTPRTIEARFRALQTVLASERGGSALRDRLIVANPCAGVQLPTKPDLEVEIYEPDEVDALLDVLDPWWVALCAVAVDLGLRWGELMGLQTDDFGFGYTTVTVRRTILELTKAKTGNGTRFKTKDYPKGRKQRFLAVSPDIAKLVEYVIAERALQPGDRLFSMPDKEPPPEWHPPLSLIWTPQRTEVWPHGLPVSRNHFRDYVWLPAIEKAGVPVRTPHDLRATNISWLLAGTQNVAMVMERAGHVDFETTRKYVKTLREANTEAVDALAAVRVRFGSRARAQ